MREWDITDEEVLEAVYAVPTHYIGPQQSRPGSPSPSGFVGPPEPVVGPPKPGIQPSSPGAPLPADLGPYPPNPSTQPIKPKPVYPPVSPFGGISSGFSDGLMWGRPQMLESFDSRDYLPSGHPSPRGGGLPIRTGGL